MKLERIVTVVYLLCLVSLMCLYGWYTSEIQRIEEAKEARRVKPVYEKIIEYADDDEIIEKEPPDIIEETEDEIIEEVEDEIILPNLVLTDTLGRVQGPQNEETYYNLPMELVIEKMRDLGYSEIDYPYYIREDGVKMLGSYIMVATDTDEYPKGTIVQTSLGQGIVCDKCEHGQEFDIAVEW